MALDTLIGLCLSQGAFGWALHFVNRMEKAEISPDKLKFKKMFFDLYRESVPISQSFNYKPGLKTPTEGS